MTNFEKKLFDVKNSLANESCVKEYFYYKKLIENDTDLKKLNDEMKKHQKLMCQNKKNDELYSKEKELFEECKNKLENNPILINYQIAKDEVFSLLVDIKQVLS